MNPREPTRPNVLFVFADQLRAQATGYGGDTNARTPVLDALAASSVDLTHAVSGHPVCCPFRASLLTGQFDTSHGVIINDVPITPGAVGLGDAFKQGGFDTAYVGKWHAYGSPEGKLERRASFVPAERRFGFDTYFKGFECSHNYNQSPFYDGDNPELQHWDGYDTISQTDDMCSYLEGRAAATAAAAAAAANAASDKKPFVAMLSWGTPHDPYDTAPPEYAALYPDGCPIELRPNVPAEFVQQAAHDLRGYYAHIAALDDCMARLLATLEETGLASNTIVCFTSDHGDMIGCQGIRGKHVPWDESIRVPFLFRLPPSMSESAAANGRKIPLLIDAPVRQRSFLE
jgi:arylsulfatase A-like enzyme